MTMRNTFTMQEEGRFERLKVFQTEIAEQQLRESPCPLLIAQLNEMEVMAEKLLASVRALRNSVNK